jgi:hypothetical protein
LPNIPNKAELSLLESELYAKTLKEKELLSQGIDPEKIREKRDEQISLKQSLIDPPEVKMQNYKKNMNIDQASMERSYKEFEVRKRLMNPKRKLK